VIGITATRIVERYRRPALVISRDGDEAHGSGRSIPAFHLLNALESCADIFTRYGGHAHAVGFGLPTSRLAELRTHLDEYAHARLTVADFEPILNLDAALPLEQVTPELFQALCHLEPFGMGNPEPVFSACAVRVMAPPRLIKDKHVKLKLSPSWNGQEADSSKPNWKRSLQFDALGWHMAESVQKAQLLPGDTLDIAFSIDQNDHPEFGGLELSLRDIKIKTAEEAESKLTRAIGT
jgi:single-stranded-DNA-specific exonuclease